MIRKAGVWVGEAPLNHPSWLGTSNPPIPSWVTNFGGLLDEGGLYNRVLSLSDVQSIFNARGAGKCRR